MRQLGQVPPKLLKWNGYGPRDVSSLVFLHWTNVQDDDLPLPHPLQEGIPIHRFHSLSAFQELALDLLNFCQPALSKHSHGTEEFANGLVGEAVGHEQPHLFGLHQASCPENLQMLGGVGHAQACFFGKNLHRPFPLAKEIQKFQSLGTGNRFSNASKLLIDGILKGSIRIPHAVLLDNSIN